MTTNPTIHPWQSVTEVLHTEHASLNTVFSKIQQLKQLDTWFKNCLEQDHHLAKRCHVANLRENILILVVDNASIATQLRLLVPELLKRLKLQHSSLQDVQHIHCKVRLPASGMSANNPTKRSQMTLSSDTAAAILETAKTLQDPKLRSIMERIAERAAKKD